MSDAVIAGTVGAVGLAAAGLAAYFATRDSSDDNEVVGDCEYDASTEVASCDCASNTQTSIAVGKATNPSHCAAERVITNTPCDDASRTAAGCSALDCKTSAWTEWSECDCGTQLSTRTRTVTQQASLGGAACGPLVETSSCSASCSSPDAPDCSLDPKCTAANPCTPVLNGLQWECKYRCDQNRTVACDPVYQEEVCAVPPGTFGQFSCEAVCDLTQRPDCVKPGCCKASAGCVVKVEAPNGMSELRAVRKGEWYCEDPCSNQVVPTCAGNEEAACQLGVTGHRLQCASKCRVLPRPDTAFSDELTCKVDSTGVPSWQVSSMCAGKPIPVCANQSRTAAAPQCLLTDAARAKPAGTAYTSADFDWKCVSPCGNEPPCAAVPGITPMVCAQDPVSGTYQWTGTCIRNVDVEKCGPYLCSSNETAYCTTSGAWTTCVDSSCRPNPDPNYACPAAGADPLIDYKELCDPVTKVVICKPQCKPTPPASLIYDAKTQYPFCDATTGFRYEARNYGDTMCSAAKPGPNFRCVPGDSGWGWVDENVYLANRWQYVDYIQRLSGYAPNKMEAVNVDNPSGPKVTVLCQDPGCAAPISPTIGVGCAGSAVVAKALEGALGNPIGNLGLANPALSIQTPGNLLFYPRDASKRMYYRPNRDNFDLVCPLMGSALPTCSNNGTFVQSSPYNPLELSTAVKPYSGSLSGACSCSAGWLGPNCQYSNATDCNNRGIVDATGKCISCQTDFAGSKCQFSRVAQCGSVALSISTAADGLYTCSCPTGYYTNIPSDGGRLGCVKKDSVLNATPFCAAPCSQGTTVLAATQQPANYCTEAINGGVSCATRLSTFCAATPSCTPATVGSDGFYITYDTRMLSQGGMAMYFDLNTRAMGWSPRSGSCGRRAQISQVFRGLDSLGFPYPGEFLVAFQNFPIVVREPFGNWSSGIKVLRQSTASWQIISSNGVSYQAMPAYLQYPDGRFHSTDVSKPYTQVYVVRDQYYMFGESC